MLFELFCGKLFLKGCLSFGCLNYCVNLNHQYEQPWAYFGLTSLENLIFGLGFQKTNCLRTGSQS